MGERQRRRVGLAAVLALMVGVLASPASATKPDPDSGLEDGHKIWICHATNSLSNPYVKILIDIAAWDVEDPDKNDHGPEHHAREKNGVEWADYALGSEDEECRLEGPEDPPPLLCPDGSDADYVVDFGGTVKLTPSNPTLTVSASIPAGDYSLTLISGDEDRGMRPNGDPFFQPNERWRVLGTPSSGYSADLVDGTEDVTGVATYGLDISFATDVTQVTAEHWAVQNGDRTGSSVIPEYACLTEEEGGADV